MHATIDLVNSRDYFALYVDGTNDQNGVECISIDARYIVKFNPIESLIAMVSCTDLLARGVSEVIMHAFEIYKVNTEKLLCQWYDGAFVMRGDTGGVQAILQSELKRRIHYVYCFSLRLHLAVLEVVKKIDMIRNFFDQSTPVYKFSKLYKVKKLYEGTSLQKIISMKWSMAWMALISQELRAFWHVFQNHHSYDEFSQSNFRNLEARWGSCRVRRGYPRDQSCCQKNYKTCIERKKNLELDEKGQKLISEPNIQPRTSRRRLPTKTNETT